MTLAPPASVPADVLEHIRARGLNRPDGRATARRLASHVVLYAALMAAAEWASHPVVWVAAWFIAALVLLGALAASHEAVHNNLFARKRANRIAGTLLAAAAAVPWSAYRAYHLAHHADTRGPTDPEPSERVDGPLLWLAAIAIGGASFAVQQWWAVIASVLGRPPRWASHRVHARALRLTAVGAMPAVALVVLLATTDWRTLLRWWGIPVALVWGGLVSFVAIPEHNGLAGRGSAFTSTRTTRSSAPLRWLFWNNNFHTAHHLVPTVPWYRLDELQSVIETRCEHVEAGYLRYHLGLLLGHGR